MKQRILTRLLGVALILTIVSLSTQATSDWHTQAYNEQHCQACHMGHAAAPQAAPQISAQSQVPVARLAHPKDRTHDLSPVKTLSIPRAPPA